MLVFFYFVKNGEKIIVKVVLWYSYVLNYNFLIVVEGWGYIDILLIGICNWVVIWFLIYFFWIYFFVE